jgi:endonuclease/exonuclease/phosphatase family metal-dependent hydrolase
MSVVDALNPTAGALSNLVQKVVLFVGMSGWACLTVVTTLPGIALRVLGVLLQRNSFIYEQGSTLGKVLPPDRTFSLLSWNICGIVGGFPITDGGVLPWSFRIDAIMDKIIEKDADVNCLCEVFDVQTATYICEKLKEKGYTHFYYNMGARAVGLTSGILVASKYTIKNPEFTPFPQDALVGRTKFAAKGFFEFDVESQGGEFARVFATHLQHSEEPEFPTAEEVEARRRGMQMIVNKVNTIRDRCIVVTGDLNLDDTEYNSSSWHHLFQRGGRAITEKTWGGDAFCAKLKGDRISSPLNLDYTLVANGTARSINTTLVKTGFDSTVFKAGALSDHVGLYSQIAV